VKLRNLTTRRPSAALVVSSAALFMSMGGVGVAATGMIGTAQIRNDAVTYKKIAPNSVGQVRLATHGVVNSKIAHNAVSYKDIQPGAVGTVRSNINQMQERVKGTCPAGSAFATVNNKGAVTCNATAPEEYGTNSTAKPVTLTGTAATTGSVALPTGPTYLGFASTMLTATSDANAVPVTVKCTFTVGSTTTSQSKVLTTDGTKGDTTTATIPMQQLPGAAGTSTVACTASVPSGDTLPGVTGISAINAIATAANN
jgi:dihydroxyacetone kinase